VGWLATVTAPRIPLHHYPEPTPHRAGRVASPHAIIPDVETNRDTLPTSHSRQRDRSPHHHSGKGLPQPSTLAHRRSVAIARRVLSVVRLPALVTIGVSLLLPEPASAHITLLEPDNRTDLLKTGPCGESGGTRGDVVTVFEPGETITVSWDETVNHTGHFRISFDPDGQDDFADPRSYDDFYTNGTVLLDDIPDTPDGGISVVEVELPDTECENCTLQLLQVMTDKPPFGPDGGSDFYYQCADLALRSSVDPEPDGLETDSADATGSNDTAMGGRSDVDATVDTAPEAMDSTVDSTSDGGRVRDIVGSDDVDGSLEPLDAIDATNTGSGDDCACGVVSLVGLGVAVARRRRRGRRR